MNGPSDPRPNALRRTSSSAMGDRRSSSPSLLRKASTGSLRSEAPGTPHRPISRRSSSHMLNSPTIGGRFPLAPQMEEEMPPPPTPASIAAEHFRKELELHQRADLVPNTVVILHDACYGHRFSRPKTTKGTLSMIVERPERLHAGVLGITTAYVRIGERHAGGENAPHPDRAPSEALPFRIKRTSRAISVTSPVVTNVHGTAWMGELKTMCDSAGQKLATTGKELIRPNATTRVAGQPTPARLHEGDLYLCAESLDAFQGALGGVCDGVDAVFQGTQAAPGPSTAFVCVRPPGHHCSADHPSGFCWLNNVHVGIEYAAQTYGLTHAAIIDFDLHHGDGSQSITWSHNAKMSKTSAKTPMKKQTAIGYYSLHDINSYPCEEGDIEKVQNASLCIESAHGQSIWNVHLQPWKNEAEFWQLYESRYKILLDKARIFLKTHSERLAATPNAHPPKAAIFLSAGFDASEWESQGMQRHKVNVPTEFYARLTADVVKLSKEAGLSVDGRIVSVLEGGYSDRALTSGVLSHLSGLCDAAMARPKEAEDAGGRLAREMGRKMAALALGQIDVKLEDEEEKDIDVTEERHYQPHWWHSDCLIELEALSGSQPAAKKPVLPNFAPTYSSPTQSFKAKAVDPSKIRQNSRQFSGSRPITPSMPDVDWATAAFELHKLLIPTDHNTRSCAPEELSDTTRIKKERPAAAISSAPSVNGVSSGGRQLRDRKVKIPPPADTQSDNESVASKRTVSRSDRRKTIGDLPLKIEEDEVPRSSSRRLSVASSVSVLSSVAGSVGAARKAATAPKTTSGGMQVKKTRGKADPVPATTAPPVPRVPSAFANRKPSPTASSANQQPATAATLKGDADAAVSELATGLQRIRIKVPTDEERAAKAAKKAADDAEKKRATTATKASTRKPAAPRGTKAGATTKRGVAAKSALPAPVASNPAAAATAVQGPPAASSAVPAGQLQHNADSLMSEPASSATLRHDHKISSNYSASPFEPPPSKEPPLTVSVAGQFPPMHRPRHAAQPSGPTVIAIQAPTVQETVPELYPTPPANKTSTGLGATVAVPQNPPNQFIAYQPTESKAPKPAAISSPTQQATQFQWLPPNSDLAAANAAPQPKPIATSSDTSSTPVALPNQGVEAQPAVHAAADSSVPKPSTPTANMRPGSRGRNLPVFTANSPIPFAKVDANQQRAAPLAGMDPPAGDLNVKSEGQKKSKDVDIWEVPETPVK